MEHFLGSCTVAVTKLGEAIGAENKRRTKAGQLGLGARQRREVPEELLEFPELGWLPRPRDQALPLLHARHLHHLEPDRLGGAQQRGLGAPSGSPQPPAAAPRQDAHGSRTGDTWCTPCLRSGPAFNSQGEVMEVNVIERDARTSRSGRSMR